MKRGFGLIEVLAAALVLGFLLVALNILQKGNREGILRIRARDVANVVAQDVIDSISAMGSASLRLGEWKCPDDHDLCIIRTFNENKAMEVKVEYSVAVEINEENAQKVDNETGYTKAIASSSGTNNINLTHHIAKQVDVTVKWKFKNSDQSINVSALVR